MVIMITAAAVLNPCGIAVQTAGDMALQLEPLLGRTAKYLFALGLWGASFSSLVANAIVGGGLLSDGLGLGARFESRSVKACSVALLLVGAGVTHFQSGHLLDLIVFAQRITIIFVPLCAVVLMLIANNKAVMGEHTNRPGLNILGVIGLLVITGLAGQQFVALLAH